MSGLQFNEVVLLIGVVFGVIVMLIATGGLIALVVRRVLRRRGNRT